MHTTHVYKYINKMFKRERERERERELERERERERGRERERTVGRFQLARFWSNPCLLGIFKSFG